MRCVLSLLLVLGLMPLSPGQVRSQKSGKATRAKAAPRVRYDPAAVNQANASEVLDEQTTNGSAVVRAQILLDRANFSVGEIDGRMGANTVRAVTGFRAARGLPAGTTVDADVWKALEMDPAPALVEYTLTAEDVKGPFVKVPADMMAKARLKYLGYSSALEGIAEKFHIAPALLRQLNPGTRFNAAGQKMYAPNVLADPPGKAARVVVSKSDSTLKVFNETGQVIAQYPATTGSEYDPLPIGEWQITGVFKNPKFHYNPKLFWDADAKDSKATIAPGPNNPVGLVWIDLSKEHYGIHGAPAPSQIAHTESHGCIRLSNWDAMELAAMVEKGTPVSLTE
jgi:lipoprotein-anchoring transpeptidase ErfK/SrfK